MFFLVHQLIDWWPCIGEFEFSLNFVVHRAVFPFLFRLFFRFSFHKSNTMKVKWNLTPMLVYDVNVFVCIAGPIKQGLIAFFSEWNNFVSNSFHNYVKMDCKCDNGICNTRTHTLSKFNGKGKMNHFFTFREMCFAMTSKKKIVIGTLAILIMVMTVVLSRFSLFPLFISSSWISNFVKRYYDNNCAVCLQNIRFCHSFQLLWSSILWHLLAIFRMAKSQLMYYAWECVLHEYVSPFSHIRWIKS